MPNSNITAFPTNPKGRALLDKLQRVLDDANVTNFFVVFEYHDACYGHTYSLDQKRHGANDRLLGTVERMKGHMVEAIISIRERDHADD